MTARSMACKIKYYSFKLLLAITIGVFIPRYSNAQEKEAKIKFQALSMEVDKNLGNGAKRLLGKVVFTHGGAKMYCDSAYYYSEINSLDAFNDVYINQGDTVHLYGNFLHYDGNTKIANVRGDVELINRETTLKTQALDYDLGNGIGFYTNSAQIVNNQNTIESIQGYYYTRTDWLHFRDSVIIVNPEYTIYSDTIRYHTETKISHFYGPTEIISDSNYIYCEKGWYDTQNDVSQLNQNALVKNKKQTIKGDSLYYERNTGFGRAVKNVEIIDSEQEIILKGNWGLYYENTDYAVLTDQAQFIQITAEDSIYVHADTLRSEPDTSGNRIIKAYYGVRLFKSNLQAVCDSMSYTFVDSIARLYNDPILWSEANQLSADFIWILTKNRQIDKMYLERSSFIVNKEDSVKYNQIKGRNMVCHFARNQLYQIDVNGNGQTIYYPKDEDEIIGANKSECSDMILYLNDGEFDRIKFLEKPNATLYPLEQAPQNELILKGFSWQIDIRPKTKEDIFLKTEVETATPLN